MKRFKKVHKYLLIIMMLVGLLFISFYWPVMNHDFIADKFNNDIKEVLTKNNIKTRMLDTQFGNLIANGNKCVVAAGFLASNKIESEIILGLIDSAQIYPWNNEFSGIVIYKIENNKLYKHEYRNCNAVDDAVYINTGRKYYQDTVFNLFASYQEPIIDENTYLVVVMDYSYDAFDLNDFRCN